MEAYISTAANPITDACALKAITLIIENLPTAVANGADIPARDNMAYAQFLAGMAFNNASLGYVHAMAHQLGGMYDLPHGVCNAVLLPHVLDFNKSAAANRLKDVAKAMHLDVANLSDMDAANAAIAKIRELAASIDIPENLTLLNAKAEDIPLLAKNALLDVCSATNPVQGSQTDVENIFKAAM